MEDQGRVPCASKDLRVLVNLHMVSVGMIKICVGSFMSLRLAYYLIHLLMLKHD